MKGRFKKNKRELKKIITSNKKLLDSTQYIIHEEQSENSGEYFSNRQISVPYSSDYDHLRRKNAHFAEESFLKVMKKLYQRRISYSFQVIKQFYLFPDQTISQNYSINSYSKVFFNDQALHAFVKIYETKQTEAKIWAFLCLKSLQLRKKIENFSAQISKIQAKTKKSFVKHAFFKLHNFSHAVTKKTGEQRQKHEEIVNKTIEKQAVEEEKIDDKFQSNPTKRKIIYVGESYKSGITERNTIIHQNEAKTEKKYPGKTIPEFHRNTNSHCCEIGACCHISCCCSVEIHCYGSQYCQRYVNSEESCETRRKGNLFNDEGYDLEARIQYLKKLENMYDKIRGNNK